MWFCWPHWPKLKFWNLAFGMWNVTSLGGKEPEIVRGVERYQLNKVGLPFTHSQFSPTTAVGLYHSRVAHGERLWAGAYLLVRHGSPKRIVRVCPLSGRSLTLQPRRTSNRYQERPVILSPSGPCILPLLPLLLWGAGVMVIISNNLKSYPQLWKQRSTSWLMSCVTTASPRTSCQTEDPSSPHEFSVQCVGLWTSL